MSQRDSVTAADGVALKRDIPAAGVGVSSPERIGVGPFQAAGVGVSPNLPLPET